MAARFVRLPLFVLLVASFAAPAEAVTYLFAGQCTDCLGGTGIATATLVLQDYTPGDPILDSNLVSFTYDGTDLIAPFTITPATMGGISGALPPDLPAFADFAISLLDPVLNRTFVTELNGDWAIDDDGPDDFGTNGTWSVPVPEPATLLPMVMGVLTIGLARRSRW